LLFHEQVKYKEAYEANKGKGATPVPETPEMALAKQLHPVQSNKLYSEKSKKMLKDVNVPPGMIEKCFQLFQTYFCFETKKFLSGKCL